MIIQKKIEKIIEEFGSNDLSQLDIKIIDEILAEEKRIKIETNRKKKCLSISPSIKNTTFPNKNWSNS